MADQFRTEITADGTNFNAAMQSVQAHLASVGGAFAKFQGLVLGVGTAIAGGGMFGAAVNESKELAVESQALARALGISATEASVLAVALGDIYQSSDVMLTANRAITRAVRENEEAFKALGVATRDGNGDFRNSLDIMLDVNKRLAEFEEGINRNIEGQKIYKKSWEEVAPVLKLTADLMEHSRAKAEALGLTVGAENLAAVTEYRAAMNDVGDVMKAVGKAIGDVVMPVLTDLGNWFASTGPDRVNIMRGAVAVLVAGFYSLSTVLQTVWEFIKAFVQTAVVAVLRFAEVAEKALALDFSGAKEAWARGGEQQLDIWRAAGERVKAVAEENGRKTADAFERGFGTPVVTATQRVSGTGSAGGDDKGRVQKWEADLAEARAGYNKMMLEQGSFEEQTKEMERDYWKHILDTEKLSKEERAAVSKKYYDAEIANIKVQMKQKQQLGGLAIEEERASQLQIVELQRNNVETLEQLGQITAAQKLDMLRELKRVEYEIEAKALQDKLAILALDPSNPVAYQEQLNRIEELKRKHAVAMNQIDNQMMVESVRIWSQIGDAVTSAVSTSLRGVMMGTQTMTKAFQNMGQAVLLSLFDMGVKAIAEAIKNAIVGKLISKQKAVVEITDNAAVAASAAMAATAAIPIIGPALAPAAGAAMFGETMSWVGALATAARGFDIPRGVNPIAQLHQEEMVLPADIANPLRESLAGGSGAGGETHLHFHGPVWNHQQFGKYLVGALRNQGRLFNRP